MVKVFCKNTGTFKEFQEGTTLLDALKEFDLGETDSQANPVLAAIVNNVVQGLRFKLYNNKDVEFVNYRSYSGRGVYTRSLCFIFTRAANDVFPGSRIFLRRPISKGYFCAVVKPDGSDVSQEGLERIKARMNELIAADLPLYRLEVQASEAIKTFSRAGRTDVVRLIETTQPVYVNYYKMGNTCDYYYNTLVPSTSYIKLWDLRKYRNGLLLMVPDRHHPDQLAPFFEQPKTFDVFAENIRWNAIMKLDNVGDVNVACQNGRASELIQVAEALQEKKIVQIAEEIDRRFHSDSKVRLVLITGPTSSGKTTFCKRLSVQLKCCGLHPISFSTDDYFVNRLDTPKLPDGNYDFDNFDTVDHVNLYKISHRVSRENNYEKILSMFNDTLQGRAPGLALIFGGTPQFLEDTRRGLFSYEALRSRLCASRFALEGFKNLIGPVIRLRRLSDDELFALISRITKLYAQNYGKMPAITEEQMVRFLEVCLSRAGADSMITPREMLRDYMTVLNILMQNPEATFEEILGSAVTLKKDGDGEDEESATEDAGTEKRAYSVEDIEF